MHTELEKRAIALAAGNSLCFDNVNGSFYHEYMKAVNDCDNGKEPDNCNMSQQFECWSWDSLIEHISNEADCNLTTFKKLLEDTKSGLIKSAIDCTLDSDFTTLDMLNMVNKGIELDHYIIGDDPMTCSECGSRTVFDVKHDGSQEHKCLQCNYKFIAVENID
ncbi:MAG: hypothetical protein QM504_11220 [Pseudomonadota bacterium]